MALKLPPAEKICEAWSALADGRVTLNDDDTAVVTSSDGTRTYNVRFDPSTDTYYSSDSATVWQHYPGYPVLAVMMLKGQLPFDYQYALQWADINWNALNKQHRRDYPAAVRHIEAERGIDRAEAERRTSEAMQTLASLPMHLKRYTRPIS